MAQDDYTSRNIKVGIPHSNQEQIAKIIDDLACKLTGVTTGIEGSVNLIKAAG